MSLVDQKGTKQHSRMWEEQINFINKELLKAILAIVIEILAATYTIVSYALEWYEGSTFLTVLTFVTLGIAVIVMYNFVLAIFDFPVSYIRYKRIKEYKENGQVEELDRIIVKHGPEPKKNSEKVGPLSRAFVKSFDRMIDKHMETQSDQATANNGYVYDQFVSPPLRVFSYWYCALSALSDMEDEKALVQVYKYSLRDNIPSLKLFAMRALKEQAIAHGYKDVYDFIRDKKLAEKVF
jgi:hypothetical protein